MRVGIQTYAWHFFIVFHHITSTSIRTHQKLHKTNKEKAHFSKVVKIHANTYISPICFIESVELELLFIFTASTCYLQTQHTEEAKTENGRREKLREAGALCCCFLMAIGIEKHFPFLFYAESALQTKHKI